VGGCPSCHRENRETARFCDWCGASLAESGPGDSGSGEVRYGTHRRVRMG